MIETKEQHGDDPKSSLREKHEQLFGPPTHEDSDAPAYIPWLEETIEALREVARASMAEAKALWFELNGSDFDKQDFTEWLLGEGDGGKALAALPDWITNE